MKTVFMFDYDGVLVDSLEFFHRGLREAAQSLGYHQIDDREAFLRLFDRNMFDGLQKAGLSLHDIPSLLKTLTDKLAGTSVYSFFPGVPDVLRSLAARGMVYVITSNVSSVVEGFLRGNGVDVVAEVLGSDKDPSKTRKIRGVMERHPGASFYYVGDTEGDMHEGREAGAKTVGVLWGWHSRAQLERARPDFLVQQPVEIAKLP